LFYGVVLAKHPNNTISNSLGLSLCLKILPSIATILSSSATIADVLKQPQQNEINPSGDL